jgi:hypothetical protein
LLLRYPHSFSRWKKHRQCYGNYFYNSGDSARPRSGIGARPLPALKHGRNFATQGIFGAYAVSHYFNNAVCRRAFLGEGATNAAVSGDSGEHAQAWSERKGGDKYCRVSGLRKKMRYY